MNDTWPAEQLRDIADIRIRNVDKKAWQVTSYNFPKYEEVTISYHGDVSMTWTYPRNVSMFLPFLDTSWEYIQGRPGNEGRRDLIAKLAKEAGIDGKQD